MHIAKSESCRNGRFAYCKVQKWNGNHSTYNTQVIIISLSWGKVRCLLKARPASASGSCSTSVTNPSLKTHQYIPNEIWSWKLKGAKKKKKMVVCFELTCDSHEFCKESWRYALFLSEYIFLPDLHTHSSLSKTSRCIFYTLLLMFLTSLRLYQQKAHENYTLFTLYCKNKTHPAHKWIIVFYRSIDW